MRHNEDLQAAVDAVRAAARAVAAVPVGSPAALEKGVAGPVTVADLASQAVAIGVLRERFGAGVAVVAEESADEVKAHGGERLLAEVAGVLRDAGFAPWASRVGEFLAAGAHVGGSDRFWAIDPLDGTKGYLRGGQFAIAVALLDGGRPVAGALAVPRLGMAGTDAGEGVILSATLGAGARQEPLQDGDSVPVRARPWRRGDPLRLAGSVERAHSSSDELEAMLSSLGKIEPLRVDSQAKYGLVARGDADAYVRRSPGPGYRECIWDHAAGALVAAEAGCEVTDVHGAPLGFSAGRRLAANEGVVCAVPALRAAIVDALAGRGS